jgi:lipopolysaccharide export system permease protein
MIWYLGLLPRYLIKEWLKSCSIIYAVLFMIAYLFNFIEILRGSDNDSLAHLMLLASYQVPFILEQALLFIVLTGTLWTMIRLTKTQEIIIMKASGFSVRRIAQLYCVLGVLMGLFFVAVYNPISTMMLKKFEIEQIIAQSDEKFNPFFSFLQNGIWLKQKEENGQYFILHAKKIEQEGKILKDIMVLHFNPQGYFLYRIDAPSAILNNDIWSLTNAKTISVNMPQAKEQKNINLGVKLKINDIEKNIMKAEILSFWDLIPLIYKLDKIGVDADNHRLHLYSFLTFPFMVIVMIMVAIVFAPKSARFSSLATTIAQTLLLGLALYIIYSLSINSDTGNAVPLFIKAWLPVVIAISLLISLLFHKEFKV